MKHKQTLAMLLAAAMVLSMPLGAYADEMKPVQDEPDTPKDELVIGESEEKAYNVSYGVNEETFEYEGMKFKVISPGEVELTKLLNEEENIIIPDEVEYLGEIYSVTKIEEYAFSACKSIKTVTIPESVSEIGEYCFFFCTSLESVDIPDTVTTIPTGMFHGCSSLETVSMPNNLTDIGAWAFVDCKLENINIPDTTTSIGEGAFRNCKNLKSVVLPEGLETIETETFDTCSSLESVNIPSTVTSINNKAFSGCSSVTSLSIPNSVQKIGEEAFRRCEKITEIHIPEGIEIIEKESFESCGITDVQIPSTVKAIEEGAFSGSNLKTISIPSNVKTVGRYAFYGCNYLEEAVLEGDLDTIAMGCFQECDSLKNVSIPDTVKTIDKNAFYGCNSLSSIDMPNDLISIGSNAFCYCTSLDNVTIPSTVEKVDEVAFGWCYNLKTIQFSKTTPPVFGKEAFTRSYDLTTIKVPKGSDINEWKEALKNTDLPENYQIIIDDITPQPDPDVPPTTPDHKPSRPGSSANSSNASGVVNYESEKPDPADKQAVKAYNFWQDAKSKIRKTAEGKTLRLSVPKEITNMPASVMETLRKENVGLRLNWNGKTITIPAGKAQPKQKMRIYWTMQTLEKLYNA